jgi:hypothetical protein
MPRTLGVFDARTGQRVDKLDLATNHPLQDGAFSPDGRLLALDFGSDHVRLYELASRTVRRELGQRPPERQWAEAVDFNGGDDGSFIRGPLTSAAIAFAPDCRTLALGAGSRVRLVDVVTGKELKSLTGHQGTVRTLCFGPNGRTLVSAGADTTGLVWNVAGVNSPPAPQTLTARQLADAWDALLSGDGRTAGEAIGRLAQSPAQTVPCLKKSLRPVAKVDTERVARLIDDLGRPEFKARSQAAAELEKLGELVRPALERALKGEPSLEMRRRLETLLARTKVEGLKGELLRGFRAVEVLERIGTPEARQVLSVLAEGAPGAVLTEAAAAACRRWPGR